MPQPDIIVIDDDPMVGELSRDLLTDEGYSVLLVQESLQALPAIKANMPRLIVTDIMMPGISGMDICKTVKNDPGLKHIKIIVVSGKSQEAEKQRAFQFGADFYLQKPYNVETFSKTVKASWTARRPARTARCARGPSSYRKVAPYRPPIFPGPDPADGVGGGVSPVIPTPRATAARPPASQWKLRPPFYF